MQEIRSIALWTLTAGFVFGPCERLVAAVVSPDPQSIGLFFFASLCAVLFGLSRV